MSTHDQECVHCGDLTDLDEDLLCKKCVEAIEGEDEEDEATSDFEDYQGNDRLGWTRDQHIRGGP